MKSTLASAIAGFGALAKEKLSNPSISGQPEDQLRAPFEHLLGDLAELVNIKKSTVVAVGEVSDDELKTRPDYAVTVRGSLVGYVELKAPGKGSDPRRFKDPHDRAQWERLRLLPNLLYTDGNEFSLWQNGELSGTIIRLIGDVESSGNKLEAPAGVLPLFEKFLGWEPIPPRTAKELAHVSARLCRLLRDEVTEQLALIPMSRVDLETLWTKRQSAHVTNLWLRSPIGCQGYENASAAAVKAELEKLMPMADIVALGHKLLGKFADIPQIESHFATMRPVV